MEWDLQKYLSEMDERNEKRIETVRSAVSSFREEVHVAHGELTKRLDKQSTTVQNHETRLVVVENTRRTIKMLVGIAITAIVGVFAELLFGGKK